MNVAFIGTDKSIIAYPYGDSRRRQLGYAKYFSKLYIIIFSLKEDKLSKTEVANAIFLPTNSSSRWFFLLDALKIVHSLKVDIISAQDPFIAGLTGVLAKFLWGIKLNVQLHIDLFGSPYFRMESLQNFIFFLLSYLTFF